MTKNSLDNKFFAFLKLIRFENLLMIVATLLLLRFLVLKKVMNIYSLQLEMNSGLFYLLILSTVLIAAAGYIINDYFDVKTDLINRPETVVVDKVIKRRWAIILHITLTTLGIIIGVYTALKTGYLRLSLFHFIAAILLWVYSTHFKKQLLIGNIVVSLLTASVAFMPLVYEMGLMQKINPGFILNSKYAVFAAFRITLFFGVFAFLTSFAREILKDIEDYKGDKETGGKTMPIVWGVRSSKLVSFFVLIITTIFVSFMLYNIVKSNHQLLSTHNFYIIGLMILPLIFLAFYSFAAMEVKQYKRASQMLKLIMLAGLCYSFVFYYLT
jgi:4-hydroxybenzoate polyprenyltransferase